MRLAVPHTGMIAVAMCALLVNSGARIWLPSPKMVLLPSVAVGRVLSGRKDLAVRGVPISISCKSVCVAM